MPSIFDSVSAAWKGRFCYGSEVPCPATPAKAFGWLRWSLLNITESWLSVVLGDPVGRLPQNGAGLRLSTVPLSAIVRNIPSTSCYQASVKPVQHARAHL